LAIADPKFWGDIPSQKIFMGAEGG
jgi:hypothetical protein